MIPASRKPNYCQGFVNWHSPHLSANGILASRRRIARPVDKIVDEPISRWLHSRVVFSSKNSNSPLLSVAEALLILSPEGLVFTLPPERASVFDLVPLPAREGVRG